MLVFISSFVSPHTLPFCLELTKYYDKVVFINTMTLTEERKRMGYDISYDQVEILDFDEKCDACRKLIYEAKDVILACARFDLLFSRINSGKRVFIAHERIFKKGAIKWLDPRTWKMRKFFRSVRDKNVYMLSIGDFAARDFRLLGFNKNKIYRFGYFPSTNNVSFDLVREKRDKQCRVIWVGRMVNFKRPKMAVKAFSKLPAEYSLTMVGDGMLLGEVERYLENKKINVTLVGNIPNSKVRELMIQSDVLLSTSDKGEGWGAVINEGMSCGCAIVCSDTIGCAGTLVDNDNAVLFKTNSLNDLVRAICVAKENLEILSKKSLATINDSYNPARAAERFVRLAESDDKSGAIDGGVCSKVF